VKLIVMESSHSHVRVAILGFRRVARVSGRPNRHSGFAGSRDDPLRDHKSLMQLFQ